VRHERFTEQRRAERESVAMLRAVPRNGILFAYGDNDTYPLWYFQQVRHFRRDVTVVTIPLLGSPWYRAELMRRYQLLDTAYVTSWHGRDRLAANIRSHAALLHRDVVLSPAWAQARKQDP
jgi:hypothetical protein